MYLFKAMAPVIMSQFLSIFEHLQIALDFFKYISTLAAKQISPNHYIIQFSVSISKFFSLKKISTTSS